MGETKASDVETIFHVRGKKIITKLVVGVRETGGGWWLPSNNASVFTEVNILKRLRSEISCVYVSVCEGASIFVCAWTYMWYTWRWAANVRYHSLWDIHLKFWSRLSLHLASWARLTHIPSRVAHGQCLTVSLSILQRPIPAFHFLKLTPFSKQWELSQWHLRVSTNTLKALVNLSVGENPSPPCRIMEEVLLFPAHCVSQKNNSKEGGEQCCTEHVESLRPHSDTGLVLLPEVMLLSPHCTESPFSAF